MEPTVSVVITAYNVAAYIGEALQTVLLPRLLRCVALGHESITGYPL